MSTTHVAADLHSDLEQETQLQHQQQYQRQRQQSNPQFPNMSQGVHPLSQSQSQPQSRSQSLSQEDQSTCVVSPLMGPTLVSPPLQNNHNPNPNSGHHLSHTNENPIVNDSRSFPNSRNERSSVDVTPMNMSERASHVEKRTCLTWPNRRTFVETQKEQQQQQMQNNHNANNKEGSAHIHHGELPTKFHYNFF